MKILLPACLLALSAHALAQEDAAGYTPLEPVTVVDARGRPLGMAVDFVVDGQSGRVLGAIVDSGAMVALGPSGEGRWPLLDAGQRGDMIDPVLASDASAESVARLRTLLVALGERPLTGELIAGAPAIAISRR